MLKSKLLASLHGVGSTAVLGRRPSRMEGPDMSPTLSLEESIREFRSNHIRLKQRSPGPSFTITDEERFLAIFILEMLEIFKVTATPCKLELPGSGYSERRKCPESKPPSPCRSQQARLSTRICIHSIFHGRGKIFSLLLSTIKRNSYFRSRSRKS